jgi:hypothetical protein
MVRFAGDELLFAVPATGFTSLASFAHLAFCASAIFRRDASEIIRFGLVALPDVPEPFKDSITDIA